MFLVSSPLADVGHGHGSYEQLTNGPTSASIVFNYLMSTVRKKYQSRKKVFRLNLEGAFVIVSRLC